MGDSEKARGREEGEMRDVGEEEEERIRVCKEGKSCDAPHYLLLARVQLDFSTSLRCPFSGKES